jgi:hypothetical protein
MKLYIAILFTLISLKNIAQQKPIQFSSINMAGISHGKAGGYLNLQTINGISNKKSFAGIGIGVDWYKYKSIITTLELRNYLLQKKHFGINAGIGYNFPFNNTPDFMVNDTYYSPSFSGGLYTNAGLFYQFKLFKKFSGIINPGFAFKKVSLTTKDVVPCLIAPCPETVSNYKYSFQTLLIKTGIIF